MRQLCCAGCQTQMFSATAAANSNVGNVGSFSFSGWNYDVQGTGGSRAIYRLNDQATFKVHFSPVTFLECFSSVRQQNGQDAAGRRHLACILRVSLCGLSPVRVQRRAKSNPVGLRSWDGQPSSAACLSQTTSHTALPNTAAATRCPEAMV